MRAFGKPRVYIVTEIDVYVQRGGGKVVGALIVQGKRVNFHALMVAKWKS